MRRPVVFLFLFFAFGIAFEFHFMLKPVLLMVSVSLILLFYSFIRSWKSQQERVKLACLFLFVVLLGSLYFFLAENNADPLEKLEGKSSTVEGRIITIQIKDTDSYQMLITARKIGKRLVQVKGSMGDPAEYIGKWAVVSGTVAIPSERRNPGLFDYRLYLKTKGVRVILQTDSGHIKLDRERTAMVPSLIAGLKYDFLEKLEKEMNPEAFGMMVGMLFGDCSFISEETYEAFQKNGIAHILSVSGIHVGIVYLYINKLLGNRKTNIFYLVTAAMLIFYAALSEFSPSVIRAVVMISIHMFSKVTYRRYDFTCCIATSAIAMLLYNPFYLFNTGFQLSYMAVFCLASMIPWAERKINFLEERGKSEILILILRYVAPLLVIQIGMAPMTAYLFNYFSIASFFMNPPIIAISGIIIPLGISLIPLSYLGGFIFGVGAQAAELLTNAMIWFNDVFFLPGIGFFNMVSPSIFIISIFYGFLFYISSEFFRILYQRKRWKRIAGICSAILILSLLTTIVFGNDYDKANLIFVDVGQGDCLHIRTPEGRNILIDGGGNLNYDVGEKTLLPYLLKNGVRSIDLAIVTHLHDDHYLGIQQLSKNMEIKKFGTYEVNRFSEQKILEDTGLQKQNMFYLAGGDRIRIEKDIWIDVLYPPEQSEEDYQELLQEEKDENKSSLFLKLNYKGLTVMMTGDLGTDGEQEIINAYRDHPEVLSADILKIGHHGSRYSTSDEFLEAVDPEVAVFQVGKNNFGHPHPTIIDKCAKKGIIIYRNDLNGAIIFKYDENLWNIDSMIFRN